MHGDVNLPSPIKERPAEEEVQLTLVRSHPPNLIIAEVMAAVLAQSDSYRTTSVLTPRTMSGLRRLSQYWWYRTYALMSLFTKASKAGVV